MKILIRYVFLYFPFQTVHTVFSISFTVYDFQKTVCNIKLFDEILLDELEKKIGVQVFMVLMNC